MKRDLFSKNIEKILALAKSKTFTSRQLNAFRNELKDRGYISKSMPHDLFIKRINEYQQNQLDIELNGDFLSVFAYDSGVDEDQMLLGFKKNSFFSMSTALNKQGFSDFRNKFIFISQELSVKNLGGSTSGLTQDAIDQAFKKDYRRTSVIGKYKDKHIVFLSPKNTHGFEVITTNSSIRTSSINRSFVEMVVNVQYFVDSLAVINVFKPLKDSLQIDVIYKVLKEFNYIYPYYQSVGYYLEKIGFNRKQLQKFKNEVKGLRFYTDKKADSYQYDEYWQTYHIVA